MEEARERAHQVAAAVKITLQYQPVGVSVERLTAVQATVAIGIRTALPRKSRIPIVNGQTVPSLVVTGGVFATAASVSLSFAFAATVATSSRSVP